MPAEKKEKFAYVYILRCEGETLYTGITTDVMRRYEEHVSGKGARYTRAHKPLHIAAVFRVEDLKIAARFEYAIKHLKKEEKELLLREPERLPDLVPKLSECKAVYDCNLVQKSVK
ncbi:MAG: GIY-YIG nuclease family protein [Lachnospiraceae bacterium]|nr:GIY-YIG nuclease family protein [Lachnospiraceae bacterium]